MMTERVGACMGCAEPLEQTEVATDRWRPLLCAPCQAENARVAEELLHAIHPGPPGSTQRFVLAQVMCPRCKRSQEMRELFWVSDMLSYQLVEARQLNVGDKLLVSQKCPNPICNRTWYLREVLRSVRVPA